MTHAINRRDFSLGAAAAGTTLAAGIAPAAAQPAEPVKIRISWVVVPASFAPLLVEKKDILKHFGKSYVAEAIRFQGTPSVITALAAGEVDIGGLAFSAIGLAIENAHLDDLRIIADEVQDGVEGYLSNEFMVLKDGPIQKVEDLKGKVLATNVMGSAVDIAMRAMLHRHGLEITRDYTVIEVPFPAMRAVLTEKKADLISAVPPFALDPALRAAARTLFTERDAFGTTQLTAWTARTGFLQQHRAAMVDLMEDVLRAVHWYTDPANHKEAVAIVAGLLKQPAERFDWAFTHRDQYRDPKGIPDLAALQRNLDLQHEVGLLNARLDISRYTDLSAVEEAGKRLG
jgi:NitT/TauT family transport system substrate-binding protein